MMLFESKEKCIEELQDGSCVGCPNFLLSFGYFVGEYNWYYTRRCDDNCKRYEYRHINIILLQEEDIKIDNILL